jgi:hypothetical protein
VGKDINRNVSLGTSREQRALKALFDQIEPTIAVEFHGWYNTYYGTAKVGSFFQKSFTAAYTGKPAKYCFVASCRSQEVTGRQPQRCLGLSILRCPTAILTGRRPPAEDFSSNRPTPPLME